MWWITTLKQLIKRQERNSIYLLQSNWVKLAITTQVVNSYCRFFAVYVHTLKFTCNSSKWKSCLKFANLWPPEFAANIQALPPSIAKFSQWTSLFRGLANSSRVPILAPPFSTRRVRCFSLVWYMKVVPGPPTSQVGVVEVEETFWHLPPWAWNVNTLYNKKELEKNYTKSLFDRKR